MDDGSMLDVSYIIPFYNGELTIKKCLDSIYSVGMNESRFEIIVVDDCSPMEARLVLAEYINSHSNIRVIRHEQNKRQGGAKNTGIRAARGQYIAFADQDDVINVDNPHKALDFAIQHDVDMLACHYEVQQEDGSIREVGITIGDELCMSGKEFCEHYFQTGCNLAPWANLYKREFLLKVAHPYEENVVMEDSDWIAWHWIHADKVGIFNRPIYTWVMNPLSITHSHHYVNRADWVKYGYRKIRDAKLYQDISLVFASVMTDDGRNNIVGGMRKVWKVDSYKGFYRHLGSTLTELQQMEWHGLTKMLIRYPRISMSFLYPIGTMLKMINYAR